jgi:hypothetical protein
VKVGSSIARRSFYCDASVHRSINSLLAFVNCAILFASLVHGKAHGGQRRDTSDSPLLGLFSTTATRSRAVVFWKVESKVLVSSTEEFSSAFSDGRWCVAGLPGPFSNRYCLGPPIPYYTHWRGPPFESLAYTEFVLRQFSVNFQLPLIAFLIGTNHGDPQRPQTWPPVSM